MPPRKKSATSKTSQNSKWDTESLLSDPKSPLVSADLRSLLTNPLAWTSLSKEEQQEILSLFPDETHIVNDDPDGARPNFESLMNDDSFRYDCAAYVENLAQGRHDPQWLADAWSAHEKRKAGEFDDFLKSKLRQDWGIESPDESQLEKRSDAAGSDELLQVVADEQPCQSPIRSKTLKEVQKLGDTIEAGEQMDELA